MKEWVVEVKKKPSPRPHHNHHDYPHHSGGTTTTTTMLKTVVGRSLKRRPRVLTLLLVVLTFLTCFLLLQHLVLLICRYHEYLLALFPDPPLPVQKWCPLLEETEARSSSSSSSGSRRLCRSSSYDGRSSKTGEDGELTSHHHAAGNTEYRRGRKRQTRNAKTNLGNDFYQPETVFRKPNAKEGPRVVCLITTSPKHHQGRADHVAATWANHCTRAVFLTTAADPRLPHTLVTSGHATYDQLWGKVTQGFLWAYENLEDYEWVVKADDDTFLLVENLQAALSSVSPEAPLATGLLLRTWDNRTTYFNGGAGYVLSRGAVARLVEEGLRQHQCQDQLDLGTEEDVNMALCLSYLGVQMLDSRDAAGRQRFHIYPPQELVDPRQASSLTHLWLKQISVFPYRFGYAELSDEVISFHYVNAETMYLLYYLIYLVNPNSEAQIHQPSSPLEPMAPH